MTGRANAYSNETRLLLAAGFAVIVTATKVVLRRRRFTSQFQQENRRAYQETISEGLVGSNPERIQLENDDCSMLTTHHENSSGNQVTAVIIHGMGCTSLEFKQLAQELERRMNLFQYDRVLFVRPNESTGNLPRNASTLAKELQELLKARNIASSPLLLIGHSYGGLIAQWYTHLYKDNVKGLVLIDPAHELQFDTFPTDFAMGFLYAVPFVFQLYQKIAWTGVLHWLDHQGRFNFPPIHLLGSESPERAACARLYSEGHAWKRASMELMGCFDTFQQMKTIPADKDIRLSFADRLPIALVIAGHRQYSPTLFPQAITDAFLQMHDRSLPKAKVFMANQSDHWVHMQEPQIVLDAVDYVLEQVET